VAFWVVCGWKLRVGFERWLEQKEFAVNGGFGPVLRFCCWGAVVEDLGCGVVIGCMRGRFQQVAKRWVACHVNSSYLLVVLRAWILIHLTPTIHLRMSNLDCYFSRASISRNHVHNGPFVETINIQHKLPSQIRNQIPDQMPKVTK
jgi:hypothetical protein